MKLHNLLSNTKTSKKRIGRGHGSGRVKTSGRGQKGQNARGKVKSYFEGGQLPLIKRLPFQKGKSRNNSLIDKPEILNLSDLNNLPPNSLIDYDFLLKHHLIKTKNNKKIKLLGNGEIKVALKIKISCSKSAVSKIIQAGGEIIKNE